MEKEYWENYYKSHFSAEPSLFAQFVCKNYLKDGDTLIEFGSGNGRDSLFFAQNNIYSIAIDQCENEIAFLREKYDLPNLKFKCADFTQLGDLGFFDHVYSRFTLHSIKEKGEDNVIVWAYDHLKKGGKLLIEARSKKNELYGMGDPVPWEPDAYIYDNHFRRFVDADKLREKLKKAGFEIILAEEKPGFAPFGDSDYVFMRIVASKNIL